MDQVQIPVEENEAASRRKICNHRFEGLKAQEFCSTDSQNPPSQPTLVQDQLFWEKNCVCVFKLKKAVQNGNEDRFVDVLEQVCLGKKLPLSAIFDQVTRAGDSMLHEAAYFGKESIAELIGLHFPQLLTKRNLKGDTPLHVAARAKSSGIIKIILYQHDAEKSKSSLENKDEDITRLTNKYGNTALHEAVCSNHVEGATLLFRADKCVAHYLNKSGQSSLYLAVLTGNKQIIDVLLEAPFPDDMPLRNCQGISPLHAAINAKNAALIMDIVAKKPELMYLRDEDGGNPLHYAAFTGYVEGVHILLNKSAPSALEWNTKGCLPIHLACKWGYLKVVKEFLEQEWADDSRVLVNRNGQDILHVAAKNGRHNVTKYLLRNTKLDVNQKDKDGNTPLHLASKNFFPHILLSLTRDKRIDLNLLNNEGFTAQDTIWLQRKIPRTTRQWLSNLVFHSVGARVSNKAKSILHKRRLPPKVAWLRNGANTLMLVAILISTVTFAAGFTVPGSVYSSDDRTPHNNRGMAVLVNRRMFQIFMIFNTAAMHSSTFGCFLLFWAQFRDYHLARRAYFMAYFMVAMALVTMSLGFMAAIRLVVSNVTWLANVITITGSIFLSFILTIGIFLGLFPYGYIIPLMRPASDFHMRMAISIYGSPAKYKKSSASQEEGLQEQEQ